MGSISTPYFVLFFRIKLRLLEGDTYKGLSRGLLETADTGPVVAVVAVHEDGATLEVQVVRVVAAPREST